jgi:hypothetical protein
MVAPPKVREPEPISCDASMSMHSSLAMGLDFSWGSEFQRKVKQRYQSTVHPLGKSDHFLMTVLFGRAKFKLDCDTISIALESCIGGLCDDLSVVQLGDRVFRFSVNSRAVGFMVYDLKCFSSDSFKCYFHLWGNGGPASKREFVAWQRECQKEWTLISPNKMRSISALKALRKKSSKSALKMGKTISTKRKLNFASFLSYTACHGYEYPATPDEDADMLQAGYSCPQLERRSKSVTLPISLDSVATDRILQFGSVDSPRAAVLNSNSITAPSDPTSTPPINSSAHDEDFLRMIEDIADRFWLCDRCLSISHTTDLCSGTTSCKFCYRYDHVKKDCWRAKKSF